MEVSERILTHAELINFPRIDHEGNRGVKIIFKNGNKDWIDPLLCVISADDWTYYCNGYANFGFKNDEVESVDFYELDDNGNAI